MTTKPKSCSKCPLYKTGIGFAKGMGDPKTATALWVGEALGSDEADRGRPFCGGAGNILTALARRSEWISTLTAEEASEERGIPERLLIKHGIYLDNVLRCQPSYSNKYPKGKTKEQAEACCRQYDPALPNVKSVVAFGDHSFKLLSGQRKGGITLWQGSVLPSPLSHAAGVESPWHPRTELVWSPVTTLHSWSSNGEKKVSAQAVCDSSSTWLTGVLHPASLMRDPHGWPSTINSLQKALQAKQGKWVPPQVRLFRLDTLAAVRSVLRKLAKQSTQAKPVSCDIENTKTRPERAVIQCVAFCIEPPTSYVLPLYRLSGEPFWSTEDEKEVVKLMAEFFASAYVLFQHGMHDVDIIEKRVGQVRRWVADLCYLHAAAYGELKHNLGYIGSTWTNYPQHKTLGKISEEEAEK